MAKKSIFADGAATDHGFINTRTADNSHSKAARAHCEQLWDVYEPYADPEFTTEIRKDFDARYWEMYLTAALIDQGFNVLCPKPGPDVGIEFEGRRIWFEATSPTRGADGAADQVPELKYDGKAHDVPNEKMILRYLNSISEKYERQYASWLKNKVVSSDDAFVIAINPRKLGHDSADTKPPRILQAAFTVGAPYVSINRKTMDVVDSGYQFRDSIAKASGTKVPSGVFLREEYRALSGLVCSRVDAYNRPEKIGADFQLVPNPAASKQFPKKFRLRGTYYRIDQIDDVYSAVPETSDMG